MTDADQGTADDGALLITMRESFVLRDFDRTLAAFEQLTKMDRRPPRHIRVEATCLAARVLAARQERSAARSLLKPILAGDYAKAIHYDFLAHALLDLKNYKEVARVCVLADALLATEQPAEDKSSDRNG